MRATIATDLNCPAAAAWQQVLTPQLLVQVMKPMVQIAPLDPADFPTEWQQGVTYLFRASAFGILPLGIHHLHFETIDHARREIFTREKNAIVSAWVHRISIQEAGARMSAYRDQVDVSAGLLTWPVWLFAQAFYRHRQKQWRALAPCL